ncbi:Uncharacterised protein [Lysinibacillus capsici]|uniref:Uncharacterized protein n=1 Tax=Lysinibacillus capsici TaxID=2115968 RepID=A0A2X0Z736_9BACI|nr:hypothetical protein [Lysinibacillus capsici]SPT98361.1 Uncharacterised protein [Lysinibacillus capsici]
MKRKFEVEVVRTDKYVIELDEQVMDEAWMEQFRNVFYDFYDLEDHADHIAQFRARFNNGSFYGGFIEGYGEIALQGKVKQDAKWHFPAVNIVKADEDNDIEVEVTEV